MLFCHRHGGPPTLLCVDKYCVAVLCVSVCVCVHPVQKFSDNFLPDMVTKLSMCARNKSQYICMIKERGYV